MTARKEQQNQPRISSSLVAVRFALLQHYLTIALLFVLLISCIKNDNRSSRTTVTVGSVLVDAFMIVGPLSFSSSRQCIHSDSSNTKTSIIVKTKPTTGCSALSIPTTTNIGCSSSSNTVLHVRYLEGGEEEEKDEEEEDDSSSSLIKKGVNGDSSSGSSSASTTINGEKYYYEETIDYSLRDSTSTAILAISEEEETKSNYYYPTNNNKNDNKAKDIIDHDMIFKDALPSHETTAKETTTRGTAGGGETTHTIDESNAIPGSTDKVTSVKVVVYEKENASSRTAAKEEEEEESSSTTTSSPHATTSLKEYRKKRFANTLGFLTGYSDVIAFNKYQTFPTMMSGNTLWIGRSIVEGKYLLRGILYYTSIITCYSLGLIIFRRRLTNEDKELRRHSLKYCGTLVATMMILSDIIASTTKLHKVFSVGLLAISYGIINSIGSEVSGTMTFVVTGHITKLVHQIIDRLSYRRGYTKINKSTLISNISIFISFLIGGLVGCGILKYIPKLPNFTVIGIIHAIIFYMVDLELVGGAWWKRRQPTLVGENVNDDGNIIPIVEEILLVNGTRLVWDEEMNDDNDEKEKEKDKDIYIGSQNEEETIIP